MRLIKFRAWDKKEKIMRKRWDELYPECIKGLVLMQYTGLHDKNGKEIYEGDVLRVKDKETTGYDEEVGVVAYRTETEPSYAWGWRIEWLHNTHQALMVILTPSAKVEVIGNIYENPDLLENKS